MRVGRRIAVWLLSSWFVVAWGHAADDWCGLWRVQSFSQASPSVNHIFISGEAESEVWFYAGDNARPMKIREVRFDGPRLFLKVDQSGKQPLPLVFELTRSGDSLEGEWKFYHFQLPQPMTGPAKGIRVNDLKEWSPWESVERRREERILDINGYLLENAPLGDFEKFEKFWTEVEPAYYFVVHRGLYGLGEDVLANRRSRLEEWYRFLKEKKNRKQIPSFEEITEKIRDNVRSYNNGIFPHFVVSAFPPEPVESQSFWSGTPDPEEEKACACKLDRNEHFVIINPEAFLNEEVLQSLEFRRSLYRLTLWMSPSRVEDELLRQGVSLQLALKDEGKEQPSIDPAALKSMVAEVADQIAHGGQKPLPVPPIDSLDRLMGEAVPAVAAHFAGNLLETQSMQSVILMASVQFRAAKEWQAYSKTVLKAKSGEPKAVKK